MADSHNRNAAAIQVTRCTGTNLVYHRSNCPLVSAFQVPVGRHLLVHLFRYQSYTTMLCFAIQSAESPLYHLDAVYLDQ